MTTDPSREAFEKWAISDFLSVNRSLDGTDGYFEGDSHIAWQAWQAAMAHKDAELQQANEARRQAQTQLADMQEKRNRIGLDIDRALSGQVNEQSPVADRLRIIAAPKRAPTLTKEQALPIAIKAPSVRAEAGLSVGAHKDITREVADCCGGFCGGKGCS